MWVCAKGHKFFGRRCPVCGEAPVKRLPVRWNFRRSRPEPAPCLSCGRNTPVDWVCPRCGIAAVGIGPYLCPKCGIRMIRA